MLKGSASHTQFPILSHHACTEIQGHRKYWLWMNRHFNIGWSVCRIFFIASWNSHFSKLESVVNSDGQCWQCQRGVVFVDSGQMIWDMAGFWFVIVTCSWLSVLKCLTAALHIRFILRVLILLDHFVKDPANDLFWCSKIIENNFVFVYWLVWLSERHCNEIMRPRKPQLPWFGFW